MSSFLRRLSLRRLLLLCGVVVAVGASGAAIASAVDTGPEPAGPKPLAQALHEAFSAAPVEGVSARIQYTNHLFEGASLAGSGGAAGELASSPLLQGASGRLWVAKDGRVRLELQANGGDTEVVLENHTISIYGAAPNTVYRYTLPQKEQTTADGWTSYAPVPPADGGNAPSGTASVHYGGGKPSVAQIEEAISHLSKYATIDGATPTDVAGQAAYSARVSPKEGGSLLGGAELSWDANHGIPLRAALYSSTSSIPVIELTATEISYGPVESSVFEIQSPAGAKIVEPKQSGEEHEQQSGAAKPADHGHLRVIGHGVTSVLALETPARNDTSAGALQGTQKVTLDGASASELPTALGTLLSFERSGVDYLLVGALKPAALEAVARGL